MSTRSEIIIKEYGIYEGKKWEEKLKLYHHCDGYPEGVGLFLIEHVLPLLQNSNNQDCNTIANFLVKNKEDDGFEITIYKHTDIEYQYIIDIPKKEIKCYAGHYGSWDKPKCRFCIKKEIDLDKIKPLSFEKMYS